MDPDLQTWTWLLLGGALLGSELFAPKFITAFFGLGALTAAGARYFGLESTGLSTLLFAVSSVGYLFALRNVLVKRFGEGEKLRHSTSEDVRVFGSVVEVVSEIVEGEPTGRVRFEGTTWPAISTRGTLAAGTKARLLHRDNIGWVVEPADGPAALPEAVPERVKLH